MRDAISGLFGILGLYSAIPAVPANLLVLTGIIGRRPDETAADAVERAGHMWALGSILLVGVVLYGMANLLAPEQWGGRWGWAYGTVSVAMAIAVWLVLSFVLWGVVPAGTVGWFGLIGMGAAWGHSFLTRRETDAEPGATADGGA